MSSVKKIIPIELLFKKPDLRLPKLSPNGRALVYLKYENEKEQLVLKNLINAKESQLFTCEDNILFLEWSKDGSQLCYTMDYQGNENYRLYLYDFSTKENKCITPFDQIYVKNLELSSAAPDYMTFEMNKEDPFYYHPFRYNFRTGELEQLSYHMEDVSHHLFDHHLDYVGKVSVDEKGVKSVVIFNCPEPIQIWTFESGILPRVLKIYDHLVYYLAPNEKSFLSLYCYNTSNAETKCLYDAQNYDVEDCYFSERAKTCVGVFYVDYQENSRALLEAYNPVFSELNNYFNNHFSIVSASDDFGTLMIHHVDRKGLVNYYLYNEGQINFLHESNRTIKNEPLSSFEHIAFKARDGVDIEGYMLRPYGHVSGPLPLVINVHGGPWYRETTDYIFSEAQFFQNRGYVTLNINFRGSTGYGANFMNLGNKQWGQSMHLDLVDAVEWAIEKGYALREQVAIFGMSYGGYSVLAGLTFTPDVFCCGVDRVGPSDLVFIMEGLPPSWSALRASYYHRVGHPDQDREMLMAYSPIHHLDQIVKPLLIAQGYNDPRVKFTESENVVNVLKQKGNICDYHCYRDEGHVFTKQKNIYHFYQQTEEFLNRYLSGNK